MCRPESGFSLVRRGVVARVAVLALVVLSRTGTAQSPSQHAEYCAYANPRPCPLYQLSLVYLLAHAQDFHGKRVQLVGFMHLELEGDAIYLHREDSDVGLLKNGLSVAFRDSTRNRAELLSDRYVLIEGRFSATNRGHMGLFSGSVRDISHIVEWPSRAERKQRPNEHVAVTAQTTQDAFWSRLQSLCGKAFAGRLTEGAAGDSVMRRSSLVMHVRSCAPGEIRIPFQADADRSRTWVLTRTSAGLRLKHDHRHADGTEDAITQYGGDTKDSGTVVRQEFHADSHTASLIAAARTNIWTVEVVPGDRFAYALRRVGTDRRFRVEFDLTRPIAAPPPPWGAAP